MPAGPGSGQVRRSDAAPLGILAAAGRLPIEVAEAAGRQGRPVHIVAIDGFAGDEVARFPHERVSLGEVGRILASFARAGVREIVIAGAMQRPNLARLRIDWGFVANLPVVLSLTRGGDDSVLRRIVSFFERKGLRVVGVGEVAPGLLAPAGPIGARRPGEAEEGAFARAARLIAALGPFDVGQAVVTSAARVVAIEGVRGTDAMLRDLGPGGLGAGLGRGAVLTKLAKPGQEMRIDLPTMGPETVRLAVEAGLAGIGVGAGAAIVLERARVAEAADAAGLLVAGVVAQCPTPGPGAATGPQRPGRLSDTASTSDIGSSPLAVAARRAPTPADRRDIAIGRRLIAAMREHGAGQGAIISREHVLAVSGALPLAPFVAAQRPSASWGRRLVKGRIGVLLVDGAGDGTSEATGAAVPPVVTAAPSPLEPDLFRAVMGAGLAGVVYLGSLGPEEVRREMAALADEAGVFLMALAEARP